MPGQARSAYLACTRMHACFRPMLAGAPATPHYSVAALCGCGAQPLLLPPPPYLLSQRASLVAAAATRWDSGMIWAAGPLLAPCWPVGKDRLLQPVTVLVRLHAAIHPCPFQHGRPEPRHAHTHSGQSLGNLGGRCRALNKQAVCCAWLEEALCMGTTACMHARYNERRCHPPPCLYSERPGIVVGVDWISCQ